MKTKTYLIKFEPETWEKLVKISAEKRMPISKIIRKSINKLIKKNENKSNQ